MVSACAVVWMGGAPVAETASYRSCAPVLNPYPGTRYDGVDLRGIRASGVSCATARRVAHGGHRKALEKPPPPSGIRTFRWRDWRVTGDVRGAVDDYAAAKGRRRVRWTF